MPKIPVDPLSVTPAWLSEVLEADVHACKLEQIGIGVGLLGRLFRAHLEGGTRSTGDGRRQAPHARHHGADEPLRGPRVLYARGPLLRRDRRRQPAAARHVTTSPRLTKRHTTSSSCSKTWAGSGWPTSSSGCTADGRRDGDRRHRAPPRLLVGQRSPRVAAMADELQRASFRRRNHGELRGRLAEVRRQRRLRTCPLLLRDFGERFQSLDAVVPRPGIASAATRSCTATYGSTSCSSPSAPTTRR